MKTNPEAIVRACMVATPKDHPDYEQIQKRAKDSKPILPSEDLIVVEENTRRFPVSDPRYCFTSEKPA